MIWVIDDEYTIINIIDGSGSGSGGGGVRSVIHTNRYILVMNMVQEMILG